MANQELVKRLLVEIDGNVEKLRRELRKGEADVQAFAGKAQASGQTAGRAADVVATKQANAARAIASATETIARQGKVSGEASKQIIAQAANAAFFWGPKGAVVGAVGISVLAIVGMFARVKREAAAAAKATREQFDKSFAVLQKANSYSQTGGALAQLYMGDPTAESGAFRRGFGGLSEDVRAAQDRLSTVAARGNEKDIEKARNALNELLAQKNLVYREIERTQALFDAQSASEQSRLANLKKIAADEKATNEARAAALRELVEAEKEAMRARDDMLAETMKFSEAYDALVARTLGSPAAQVAAPFDALIEDARALRAVVDEGVIEHLTEMRDSAVAAAVAIADAGSLLQELDIAAAIGVDPTVDSFINLTDAVDKMRDALKSAIPGTEQYRRILAEIEKVERRRSDLMQGVASSDGRPSSENVRTAADYARELYLAADGALQLAQNLGGADAAAVGLLRAIGQIAGNIPALHEAIRAGNGFEVVGAALPILGALSSLFGESAADTARRKVIEDNTDAIRELTRQAGLIGLGVSGSGATDARAELARFLLTDVDARRLAAGVPGGRDARGAARAFGLDLKELDEIARAHGITLDGSIETFRQLERALADTITKLGEFGTDLESQRRQAEAEIDILGITDPAEQFRIRSRATAGRSPALDAVLAGLDPNSTESREAARQRARDLFEIMRAGGGRLGAGQLGDLAGDELLQALLDLIAGLDAIDDAVGVATGSSLGTVSGFRGLTEATGSRLEEHQRALVGYARQAQDTRLQMLAALQRVAGSPLTVPALPGGFSGSRTSGAGGLVIQFAEGAVQVEVHVTGAAADPREIGAAVQEGVTLGLEEAIYAAVKTAQVVAGDLRITR